MSKKHTSKSNPPANTKPRRRRPRNKRGRFVPAARDPGAPDDDGDAPPAPPVFVEAREPPVSPVRPEGVEDLEAALEEHVLAERQAALDRLPRPPADAGLREIFSHYLDHVAPLAEGPHPAWGAEALEDKHAAVAAMQQVRALVGIAMLDRISLTAGSELAAAGHRAGRGADLAGVVESAPTVFSTLMAVAQLALSAARFVAPVVPSPALTLSACSPGKPAASHAYAHPDAALRVIARNHSLGRAMLRLAEMDRGNPALGGSGGQLLLSERQQVSQAEMAALRTLLPPAALTGGREAFSTAALSLGVAPSGPAIPALLEALGQVDDASPLSGPNDMDLGVALASAAATTLRTRAYLYSLGTADPAEAAAPAAPAGEDEAEEEDDASDIRNVDLDDISEDPLP